MVVGLSVINHSVQPVGEPMPKATAVFAIDGFEVSATFAESQNTAAIGQVKQILLSSFAAQTSPQPSKAILVKSSKQRDNNGGGSPHAP